MKKGDKRTVPLSPREAKSVTCESRFHKFKNPHNNKFFLGTQENRPLVSFPITHTIITEMHHLVKTQNRPLSPRPVSPHITHTIVTEIHHLFKTQNRPLSPFLSPFLSPQRTVAWCLNILSRHRTVPCLPVPLVFVNEKRRQENRPLVSRPLVSCFIADTELI